MKRALITIYMTLGFHSYSQDTSGVSKPNYVYAVSIQRHIEHLRSFGSGQGQIYVEELGLKDELQNLPPNVAVISSEEQYSVTTNGKSIHLLSVRPVEFNGSTLKVTIVDFSVTRKKKHYKYANFGGSVLIWGYNCDSGYFELLEAKHHQR